MMWVDLHKVSRVTATRHRYRPLPDRIVERHVRSTGDRAPEFHRVRLWCRPPLSVTLQKSPPAGALMWEEAGTAVIFTLATLRPEDLVPWLLACGDSVEVLEPARLRQEVLRAARAIADRHAGEPGSGSSASAIAEESDDA
jgi:hypothetical protein